MNSDIFRSLVEFNDYIKDISMDYSTVLLGVNTIVRFKKIVKSAA